MNRSPSLPNALSGTPVPMYVFRTRNSASACAPAPITTSTNARKSSPLCGPSSESLTPIGESPNSAAPPKAADGTVPTALAASPVLANDGYAGTAVIGDLVASPLTLALSDDDGLSWPLQRHLETGDGYCMTNNSADRQNREYSYPSIRQTDDGALHLAYTVFRQHIRHVRVMPDWVSAGEAR